MPINFEGMNDDYITLFDLMEYVERIKILPNVKEHLKYTNEEFVEYMKKVEYLKAVLPYLDSLNVLPVVIKSASILSLTLDEIIDRKEYIDSHNGELVLPNGRFNSIFGLSRANYRKLIGKKEECLRLCRK